MSYAQAIEGLHALGHELATSPNTAGPRRKFDLDQMRVLAAALGHPELLFRSVLIAGTNGKGSTAATLASIVQAASYRVGLYTSPHLSRVNERIQINGVPISDEDFARLYFRVDQAALQLLRDDTLPHHPSFFETVTAIAFLYFAEQGVDLAVLEVGIGGRLDATNIVEPLLSIVTDISLDHTEWLGDTIAAITREKAGILRAGGTLVTLPQHPEANQALGEIAMELEVKGVNAADYMPPQHDFTSMAWGVEYSVNIGATTVQLALPLAGCHQYRNVALAIAAARELCNNKSYNISPKDIAEGVRSTRWPARLELFPGSDSRCAVLLDVAHNPAGAWSLRSALSSLPMNPGAAGVPAAGSRTLLFGCLRDKAVEEMAQIVFPVFDRVVVTPVDSPRSAAASDLLAIAKSLGVPALSASSPYRGFQMAIADTPRGGLLVCAGSVYLVGALRDRLLAAESRT